MSSLNPAIIDKLNGLSENILSGHFIFNRDIEDSYLAKRFSAPDKFTHNVTYGVSTDPKHIQQYSKLREEAFMEVIGPGFYAGIDEHDANSYKFLALAGNNCVGGIRITVSYPNRPLPLPLETDNFQIKELYKEIDFNHAVYCEASRLAFLPDFRKGNHLGELFIRSTKFSIETLGVDLVFGRSPGLQTRKFQNHYRSMGYDVIVRKDVKVAGIEPIEHLKVQLWAIDLTPDRRYTNLLNSYNQEIPAAGEFTKKELEFA